MTQRLQYLLVVAFALGLTAPVWADDDARRYWNEAQAAMRRGAYREALQSLDALHAVAPDDPWLPLYRSLCERRLKSPQQLSQLAPEELRSLQGRLGQEAQTQRRSAAQQKVLERQVRKEQARWDQELEELERVAVRERQRDAQREQAQALERARAERARARGRARQQAVETAQPEQPHPPSREQQLAQVPALIEEPSAVSRPGPTGPPVVSVPFGEATPRGPQPKGAVELQAVVVPTIPTKLISPSLVGQLRPPPGAVQIMARQMSVSPDRKIAIAEGDVEVVFENALLTADHMTLFTDTNDIYAEGRVRLEQGSEVFRGEMVHYNFNTKKGRFLQGTVASPPWYEHGRSVEHIAEGVFQVTPGYITSCDHEPPHFKFFGRRATVFADDKLARARNVALFVEQVPFLYLPWLTVADRQSPFFFLPGKHKRWGEYALMGYRYELPGNQKGTYRLDWRRNFGWGLGTDHRFESESLGKGLLKLYYNNEPDKTEPLSALPKGADKNRYRLLWRHAWRPLPDTTMITDIQEFSDVNFRKDFLFREEFLEEDAPESFISTVTSTPAYTLSTLTRKRMNRFQTVTEALPQVTLDVREQRIGETMLFSKSALDVANLQTVTAHSDEDTDVVRVDWFQQLKYALGLFRPVLVTPNAGIRQTYYTKDKQTIENGMRDVISGQVSMGADASLKLFRIFPVVTNLLGLDLHWLRHVLTPTVSYTYIHQPTEPNELLNFATAQSPTNTLSFGLENKLQTRRPGAKGQLGSVDLGRMLLSIPYTFYGHGNQRGGELGDWAFDVELTPWPWLRVESDWSYPSHFVKGSRDSRVTAWNLDLAISGERGMLRGASGSQGQAPALKAAQIGPTTYADLPMSEGRWYLGLGHRYSYNDKTEDVLQFNWRFSKKWQVNTLHRYTWKELAGGAKRFNNLREYQYILRRDLHDWIAEFIYRVDREFGEELFFTMTLKAYPELPIETELSYHQPKLGSQSSPFSPVR